MEVLVYLAQLVCRWFSPQLAGVAVAHCFVAPQLSDLRTGLIDGAIYCFAAALI
jgi:hypothetical protein